MKEKSNKKRIAVVTGASSGMGRDFVFQIAETLKGLDEIWVIARRKQRLLKLQEECMVSMKILPFDLLEEKDLEHLQEILKEERPLIHMLVNSSGFGKRGYFREMSYQDVTQMIELNCRGLTAVTSLCLPYLKKGGRIVNLASSAGFLPQPKFAIYAATKSFVLSFSRALNWELKERKISVTAVCPGPVYTEFFDIAEEDNGLRPFRRFLFVESKKVVALAMKDSRDRKGISVYGGWMKGFYLLTKILPHKILIAMADKL